MIFRVFDGEFQVTRLGVPVFTPLFEVDAHDPASAIRQAKSKRVFAPIVQELFN